MANINWTGGSGSWNTAADWSTDTTPTNVDTVTIDVPLITVTIDGTTPCFAYTLSTTSSTLSVAGGTLTTIAGASFGGAYVESSGLYMAGGTGAVFAAGITMTGGTIETLAGAALTITDGGSLGGTLSGTGQLDINGGSTYIQSGFACSLSSIVVAAKLGFDTNFSTRANFTVAGTGTVDLFGHKLTIAGNSSIAGTIGNGVLVDAGTLTLGSPAGPEQILNNGLTLDVTGMVVQSGNVGQGDADAGAKIVISKNGQYLINSNWTIADPNPSTGTLTNAGILAKTGGGKTATIATSLSNTGTIEADTGTLLLTGLVNAIGGTISGSGTLALGGAQTTFGPKIALKVAGLDLQSGVLTLNKSLSYGGTWDMNGNAVLNLNSLGETLSLTGHSDFDGGTITGYGGTVAISGLAQIGAPGQIFVIGGPNTITLSGTLDQTGAMSLGASSNPVVDILKAATWSIEADSSISGSFGLIENAGTFIDPNGSGVALVDPQFESTGTLTVNGSTLEFQGQTMLAGTVTGSGTLDLNGATTLQSGLGVSVAALTIDGSTVDLGETLSYGNIFSQIGNSTLDLGGYTMSLSGASSLDAGTLTDTGTLALAGAATIGNYNIDNAATLLVTGRAEQTGLVNMSGGTLAIASGGTYTFDDDLSIAGTGLLSLAGTLLVGSAGSSTIDATVDQTGGTLTANGQTLTLAGGGTLAGAISGTGSLVLGGGTFTLASTLAAKVADLDVRATADLAGNLSYGGNFSSEGTLNLDSATLSVTGTTVFNSAILNGGGALNVSGATTLSNLTLQNSATLAISGTAEQGPGNTYDNGGTLLIGASGTLSLDANQSIFGGGLLDVAGKLIAGGNGAGVLNVAITDTGTIATSGGTLDIGASVLGSGSFSIGNGATLIFSNFSSITAATTVGFAGSPATLDIQNSVGANMSTFGAMIADFASGDMIEINNINAQSAVGTLSANGLQYVVSDSNNDTLTLTFTTRQSQGSITVGTLNGITTLFHH